MSQETVLCSPPSRRSDVEWAETRLPAGRVALTPSRKRSKRDIIAIVQTLARTAGNQDAARAKDSFLDYWCERRAAALRARKQSQAASTSKGSTPCRTRARTKAALTDLQSLVSRLTSELEGDKFSSSPPRGDASNAENVDSSFAKDASMMDTSSNLDDFDFDDGLTQEIFEVLSQYDPPNFSSSAQTGPASPAASEASRAAPVTPAATAASPVATATHLHCGATSACRHPGPVVAASPLSKVQRAGSLAAARPPLTPMGSNTAQTRPQQQHHQQQQQYQQYQQQQQQHPQRHSAAGLCKSSVDDASKPTPVRRQSPRSAAAALSHRPHDKVPCPAPLNSAASASAASVARDTPAPISPTKVTRRSPGSKTSVSAVPPVPASASAGQSAAGPPRPTSQQTSSALTGSENADVRASGSQGSGDSQSLEGSQGQKLTRTYSASEIEAKRRLARANKNRRRAQMLKQRRLLEQSAMLDGQGGSNAPRTSVRTVSTCAPHSLSNSQPQNIGSQKRSASA